MCVGGGDGEELKPLPHLVPTGEQLVAGEEVFCLSRVGLRQQGLAGMSNESPRVRNIPLLSV